MYREHHGAQAVPKDRNRAVRERHDREALQRHDRAAGARGWTTPDGWTTHWQQVPSAGPGDVLETDSEGRRIVLRSVHTYGPANIAGQRRHLIETAQRSESHVDRVNATYPDGQGYVDPVAEQEERERCARFAAECREKAAWGEARAALVRPAPPRAPSAPPGLRAVYRVTRRPVRRASRRRVSRLAAVASAGSGDGPPPQDPPAPTSPGEHAPEIGGAS